MNIFPWLFCQRWLSIIVPWPINWSFSRIAEFITCHVLECSNVLKIGGTEISLSIVHTNRHIFPLITESDKHMRLLTRLYSNCTCQCCLNEYHHHYFIVDTKIPKSGDLGTWGSWTNLVNSCCRWLHGFSLEVATEHKHYIQCSLVPSWLVPWGQDCSEWDFAIP